MYKKMKWIPYLPSTYLLSPITSIIMKNCPYAPKFGLICCFKKISLLLTNLLRTKKVRWKINVNSVYVTLFFFSMEKKFVKLANICQFNLYLYIDFTEKFPNDGSRFFTEVLPLWKIYSLIYSYAVYWLYRYKAGMTKTGHDTIDTWSFKRVLV